VVSGANIPYVIIKQLGSSEKFIYRLPAGCNGIEKVSMLKDQNLLGFIAEGYFYIVDISFAAQSMQENKRPVVKLNIRIPHEKIQTFEVDGNLSSLVIGTNSGNIYLYDLYKAIENERLLNQKRLEMGVEDDLVHTYLNRVHANELTEFLANGHSPATHLTSIQSVLGEVGLIGNSVPHLASNFSAIQSPEYGTTTLLTMAPQSHSMSTL
jgi:hypothetical protein